jgi:sugar O-acyltransferase (sialic acid O-acetyltransferase NeuD family)
MMTKKLIIIGGEGNGGVIVSCVEDNIRRFNDNEYEMYGWLNDYKEVGEDVNGYPVLGGTSDADTFLDDDNVYFMWAVHVIARGPMRERLFNKMGIPREKFATVVHKSAFVAPNAVLEPGAFVMANTYVGPMTTVGFCSMIMANCVIAHHNDIGPFNHISAGAIVGSYIKTGKFVDICLGTTIIEKVTMGDYSVAGAAGLVLKDVSAKEVHFGNPAKMRRMIRED